MIYKMSGLCAGLVGLDIPAAVMGFSSAVFGDESVLCGLAAYSWELGLASQECWPVVENLHGAW